MDAPYDKYDVSSIEEYARRLIGKTFKEAMGSESYNNIADFGRKGGLGNLIEKYYFKCEINSRQQPDCEDAGIEVKVTAYKMDARGNKTAKERLVITMINYMTVINEAFDDSHLWAKLRLMLIIYYFYEKEISDRLDYRIDYVSLFTPPEEDLKIIKDDYRKIVEKIRSGHAHELSEADTMYLSACTKSSDGSKRTQQPNSDELAKPRAFALKSSYMTYVLNNYIIPDSTIYSGRIAPSERFDSIISGHDVVSFEKYIYDKINSYRGWSVADLCKNFDISLGTNAKNKESLIAYRILGVKSNAAEEFIKAGIKVKAIRIGANGAIREHVSFAAMNFQEVAQEEWEDDYFYKILTETKFFFVVYKEDSNGIYRLRGCKFWNMPTCDILEVKKVWQKTKELINGKLVLTRENGRLANNFPKPSENRVCHVRPHARNSADTGLLPDGRAVTKQCFWLNNSYILSQISDLSQE